MAMAFLRSMAIWQPQQERYFQERSGRLKLNLNQSQMRSWIRYLKQLATRRGFGGRIATARTDAGIHMGEMPRCRAVLSGVRVSVGGDRTEDSNLRMGESKSTYFA
jgi:hypothetical protein